MLYQHHFLGGFAVSALPARRSSWLSWSVGTALGGVLAACGGGGGGGGGSGAAMPGTNAAPVVVTTGATMAPTELPEVEEAAAARWTVSDWFSDADEDDSLTFTATLQKTSDATAMALPDWLILHAMTGVLTIEAGMTDDAEVGVYTLVVTATDDADEPASATHTTTLTIKDDPSDGETPPSDPGPGGSDSNNAPTTTTDAPTTSLTAMEGLAFSVDVSDWFTDEDAGDTLTYTETGNPSWLELDDTTGDLTIAAGMTDDADVGSYTFTLTASDGDDETELKVTLAVANVAEDPTVAAGAPAMLEAMEGLAAMWTASDWFTDEDTALPSSPDALTYAVSGNPDWLTFDAASGVLTIAARATDDAEIGIYVLAVTASDQADAMVAHTTTLEITDTENEPVLSAALSSQIAPAAGMTLTLDLTDFFTDTDEAGDLTFAVSSSVDDTMPALNIVSTMLTGAMTDMLELTPGTGTIVDGLWQQETVSITVTDSDDKQTVAAFAVTTRANVLDTGMLDPAHGFIIQGDMAGDQLGSSVAGAGDVNGDGIADLITGARIGSDGGTWAGEAYVVYGKAGDGTQFGTEVGSRQVLDTTSLVSAAGFIIQGDMQEDRLGWSVAGAGDINGDGLADLIVGEPFGDDGGGDAGEAYIVYGKAGTQFGMAMTTGEVTRQVVDTTHLAPADGFIIQGDTAEDKLGRSVSGAGDINGDGIDDLIVGANEGDDGAGTGMADAGEAYIVYGKTGDGSQFGTTETGGEERQVLDVTHLAPAAGFIIQGDVAGDELGYSVSGAGDINGDGLGDLIVGAHQGNDGGGNAGEAYIIYGEAGTAGTQFGLRVAIAGSTVTTLTTESEPPPMNSVVRRVLDTTSLSVTDGFILQGDVGGDLLGSSVSGAGDVNGDGYDDLIVGAYEGGDGGSLAGEAYIVYGKAGTGTQFGMGDGSRQVLDTTSLSLTDGFIIQGDAMGDNLGISVSGAGDVNGDGLADLVVGAILGDDGGFRAGEAYIIYGKVGTDGMQFGSAVTAGTETRQVLDTTGLEPTDGFILQGNTGGGNLGFSVSGAGDVNGDGFDDLIAGANLSGDGGSAAGEAYVVYGGTQFGEVVSHDQTLVGMAVPVLAGDETAAEAEAIARMAFLHGGAGDDRLEAHADTTVLYGGAGDDVLELADASFLRVDGGSGNDRLVLGTSLTLDLTDASVRGKVRGIETLSLSDGAEATLNLLSVYALVESRDNGGTHTSAGEAFLRLEGVGMVALGSGWTKTDNADGPDLYVQGSAKLLIDDGLAVA